MTGQDLFSATFPLEVMKLLVPNCAQGQNDKFRMAVVDVQRAYFYAPVRREFFIKIRPEDRFPGDEDMVGRLDFSLYGTRDAAQNWAYCYTKALKKEGFVRGRASMCNFHHPVYDVSITCHGDDFLMFGSLANLNWVIGVLSEILRSNHISWVLRTSAIVR